MRGVACLLGSGLRLVLLRRLCVSDGLHIGGWSGVNGAGSGLFAGFWVVSGVVAAAMCKCRLTLWAAVVLNPRYV